MRKSHSPRPAFTLVEILIVIAIIAILAAITLTVNNAVKNSQRKARTRGDISNMIASLENFKSIYGFYPMTSGASASTNWQRTLYDCLTGNKVYKIIDDKIELVAYDSNLADGKTSAVRRSFVSDANILTALDENGNPLPEEEQYFVDGWENPYAYRYNTLTSGQPNREWENPGFILISAGAVYNDPVTNDDYFSDDMETTGKYNESYFDDKNRADNITNWRLE